MDTITKSCDFNHSGSINHLDYFNENIGHLVRECKALAIETSDMTISKYISVDALKMKAKDYYIKSIGNNKSQKTSIIGAVTIMLNQLTIEAKEKGIYCELLEKSIEELDVIFCLMIEDEE